MIPGLLPGNMRLIISCSYGAANKVLNVALLVVSLEKFPDHFLGAFAKLRRATISYVFVRPFAPSVYPSACATTRPPSGRILMEFDFRIFRKSVQKIKAPVYNKKYMSALPLFFINTKGYTFRPISRSSSGLHSRLVIVAVCILGSHYVYINKIHKI